jgi:CBS domain-containing protein
MRSTGCGCTTVVKDKQSRELVGVVTERDVCHHVAAEDRRASQDQLKLKAVKTGLAAKCLTPGTAYAVSLARDANHRLLTLNCRWTVSPT